MQELQTFLQKKKGQDTAENNRRAGRARRKKVAVLSMAAVGVIPFLTPPMGTNPSVSALAAVVESIDGLFREDLPDGMDLLTAAAAAENEEAAGAKKNVFAAPYRAVAGYAEQTWKSVARTIREEWLPELEEDLLLLGLTGEDGLWEDDVVLASAKPEMSGAVQNGKAVEGKVLQGQVSAEGAEEEGTADALTADESSGKKDGASGDKKDDPSGNRKNGASGDKEERASGDKKDESSGDKEDGASGDKKDESSGDKKDENSGKKDESSGAGKDGTSGNKKDEPSGDRKDETLGNQKAVDGDAAEEAFLSKLDKDIPSQLTVKYNAGYAALKLSAEQLDVLETIVEAEAGDEDAYGKILVANVVLNRVLDEKFPDTVKEVVFQNNGKTYQFSPVRKGGRYYTVKVSKHTKAAVARALAGEDYSGGALYFFARRYTSAKKAKWFDTSLKKIVEYGCHEFFGNK